MADYMLCWNAVHLHWDGTFIKVFQYWEMDVQTNFLNLIYSTKVKRVLKTGFVGGQQEADYSK